MQKSSVMTSPIGKLKIVVNNNKLTDIDFVEDEIELRLSQDAASKTIIDELNQYFENPYHEFKIDYGLQGTPFLLRVWQALIKIPAGTTLTYGELAKKLATGPRAIGQACRLNPIPLVIPCHRIVAANHLGGFAGKTKGRWTSIKTWLLKHERSCHLKN